MSDDTTIPERKVTDALNCCEDPDAAIQLFEWSDHNEAFVMDGFCWMCYEPFHLQGQLCEIEER